MRNIKVTMGKFKEFSSGSSLFTNFNPNANNHTRTGYAIFSSSFMNKKKEVIKVKLKI